MKTLSRAVLINRAVDLALLWSFSLLAGSGLVMEYRLSEEYYLPTGSTVLGLTWKSWAALHLLSGYTTLGCIAVHLALHWRWVWTAAAQRRPLALVFVLLVAAALFAAPLIAPVIKP